MQTMGIKIGSGFDVHRLVYGRKLVLGGVDIPFDKGLLGHSHTGSGEMKDTVHGCMVMVDTFSLHLKVSWITDNG